jgi:hypothetical protein
MDGARYPVVFIEEYGIHARTNLYEALLNVGSPLHPNHPIFASYSN